MATMEYKCPSCGAPLSFNPEKQNFACDYCGSEFTVQHIQSLYAQSEKTESINEQEVRQSEEQRAQAQKTGREFNEDFMVSYSCPSCGAEIMTAESTAATECYYCGNPVVLGSRLSGEFKPDSVIPFALTKDMAVDAFMKMCGKKKFLPAGFANKKQFEKMQGVYFPYWYVDEKMQSSAVATGKKVRHWTSGNRRYTETSTYRLFRTGDIEIRNVFEEALRDKQGAPTEKPQTNRQANAQEAMKYLDNYHMQQRHEMLQCVHPFDVGDHGHHRRAHGRLRKAAARGHDVGISGHFARELLRPHLRPALALYPAACLDNHIQIQGSDHALRDQRSDGQNLRQTARRRRQARPLGRDRGADRICHRRAGRYVLPMIKTRISVKISAAAIAVLLLLSSVATAFAASDFNSYYLISDDAGLFDSSSFSGLTEKLESVGRHTSWQIAVVTTNDNVSSSKMDSHYNKLYDNNRNYFESDCVMFVIDNASGNRIILTHGETESYFSDQRMNEMKSALKPYLQSGDMLNACYTFADKTQEFYDAGIPSNGSYDNHVEGTETADQKLKRENKFLYVLTKWGWLMGLIALAAGGIFAGVNVGRYKFNGKSGTYNLKENSSMKLLDSQDQFLHKSTTSTVISSGSSSSGSSGGSSSHGSSGSF